LGVVTAPLPACTVARCVWSESSRFVFFLRDVRVLG